MCLDTISILGHRRKLFCIAQVYFLPRDSEVCLHIVDCAFTSGKMNGESTNCGRCRNVKVTDFLKCHFLFFYVCNTFPADRRSSQVCRKSKKTSLPRTSWWEDSLATDICLLQNWYRKASLIIGPHHLKKSPHARNCTTQACLKPPTRTWTLLTPPLTGGNTFDISTHVNTAMPTITAP